jgi:peptidoglycan-associated lipoprotein
MKKFLLLSLVGVFIFISFGCKTQNIKYNSQDDSIKDGIVEAHVAFSDEPSVRGKIYEDIHLKTIYFDFDKSDLTNNIRDTLKENAAYLTSNSGLKIELEGHTDNRGTTEYNLALGQRRALKVKEYYIQLGVAANRIATISYGKEKPVDLSDNEVAWAKNRRAETKVLER